MGQSKASAGVRSTIEILRRLLDGETLRVADVVGPGGERAVQRHRLLLLAELLPHVHRDGVGQGVAQTFRWVWPAEQRARPEQVWALAAARTMLQAFRDSEVGVVLTNLLEDHHRRLQGARPVREDLDRMFYAATRMISPPDLEPDRVDRLAKAITERRAIKAHYSQFGGSVHEIVVEPYTLVFGDEGPYLYGRCVESTKADHLDRKRIFNVARLEQVQLTSKVFAYPLRADHDPDRLFHSCFAVMVPAEEAGGPAEVVLRFVPSMSYYFRKHPFHVAQVGTEAASDGSITVRASLHITYDLVRWVRGHGCTVEVLEPVNLREWVQSGEGGDAYTKYVLENIS